MLREVDVVEARKLLLVMLLLLFEILRRVSENAEMLLGRALERADAMKRREDCLIIVIVWCIDLDFLGL